MRSGGLARLLLAVLLVAVAGLGGVRLHERVSATAVHGADAEGVHRLLGDGDLGGADEHQFPVVAEEDVRELVARLVSDPRHAGRDRVHDAADDVWVVVETVARLGRGGTAGPHGEGGDQGDSETQIAHGSILSLGSRFCESVLTGPKRTILLVYILSSAIKLGIAF